MTELIDSVKFEIKVIEWSEYNFQTPILLQDENGPCPLISLINTLLLNFETINKDILLNEVTVDEIESKKLEGLKELKQNLLTIERSTKYVELKKILETLGELLLIYSANKNLNFGVDKLLHSLPELHTGLSVNPNLITGGFPSGDLSSQLFEVFDLKFKHGWCLDQIDSGKHNWGLDSTGKDNYAVLLEIFNQLETFDQIQNYLLTSDSESSVKENQKLISKWLDINCTQLTDIGLKKLNMNLNPDEFVIFFRNNHFNTLLKKSDMEFYLLITDSSFNSNKLIWQSLNSVTGGDDLFFNGEFIPILDFENDLTHQDSDDFDLTRQLQFQEDEKIARQMNSKYLKSQEKMESRSRNNKSSNEKNKANKKDNIIDSKKKKDKKKSDCCIT